MDLIRAQHGLLAKVAKSLGVTRAAVVKWKTVPAERVVAVEGITGISRERLRPDLFRSEGVVAPDQETLTQFSAADV
jgi:DNA-binding transcriptional regulator YdaS (Cro superfamily)